jgi:LacI family transcriptional regulator
VNVLPPERGPTIVDVARLARVSVSTVSRVVRKHADVKAETRARVQEAIDALGYQPSPIARALVSGRSRLIALLVSDIANPFYPQLARSVEQEAKRGDYMVVICNTEDRAAETRRYLERLLQQGLDGVIHASVSTDEEVVHQLLPDRRRLVFTNRPPLDPLASYVISDNERGAEELTRYLLSKGHRRIGFIAGPPFAGNATARAEGFRRVMAEAGMPDPLVAEGDFSAEHGGKAALAWCDGAAPPTALIAVNDSVALGALEALTDRGLRVPDDVALAGFDGVHLAASPLVNLTTVDQHIDRMGRRAVRVLLRQLVRRTGAPVHEVLPTQLLVRGSTEATLRPPLQGLVSRPGTPTRRAPAPRPAAQAARAATEGSGHPAAGVAPAGEPAPAV